MKPAVVTEIIEEGGGVAVRCSSANITLISILPPGMTKKRMRFACAVTEEAVRLLVKQGAGGGDHLLVRTEWKDDIPTS